MRRPHTVPHEQAVTRMVCILQKERDTMSRLDITTLTLNAALISGYHPLPRPLWAHLTLGVVWVAALIGAHASHRRVLNTSVDTQSDRTMRRRVLFLGCVSPLLVVESTTACLSVTWTCALVLGAVPTSAPAECANGSGRHTFRESGVLKISQYLHHEVAGGLHITIPQPLPPGKVLGKSVNNPGQDYIQQVLSQPLPQNITRAQFPLFIGGSCGRRIKPSIRIDFKSRGETLRLMVNTDSCWTKRGAA